MSSVLRPAAPSAARLSRVALFLPTAVTSRNSASSCSPVSSASRTTTAFNRGEAFLYLQRFHQFAQETCRASGPGRVAVKRAVLFATQDLPLTKLVDHLVAVQRTNATSQTASSPLSTPTTARSSNQLNALAQLAQCECPVATPSRKKKRTARQKAKQRAEEERTSGGGVRDEIAEQILGNKENMTARIMYSSKRLRRFLQMSEVLTCRGCSKRLVCGDFKKAAPDTPSAGCVDVAKVLYGLAQYCRGFLEESGSLGQSKNKLTGEAPHSSKNGPGASGGDRDKKKFFPPLAGGDGGRHHGRGGGVLAAGRLLLDRLAEVIADEQGALAKQGRSLLLADVPIADMATAKELAEDMAMKKEQMQLDRKEEQILKLPPWLRDSLRPVVSKHMSARQKFVLKQREKAMKDAEAEALSPFASEEVAGVSIAGGPPLTGSFGSAAAVTTLEDPDLSSLPVPRRFQEITRPTKVDTIVQFNATYERYVEGITKQKRRINTREAEEVRVDLEKLWESVSASTASGAAERSGGSVAIADSPELVSGDRADDVKTEAGAELGINLRSSDSGDLGSGAGAELGKTTPEMSEKTLGEVQEHEQTASVPTEAREATEKNFDDPHAAGEDEVAISPVDALFASLAKDHAESAARVNTRFQQGRDEASDGRDHDGGGRNSLEDSNDVPSQHGGYSNLDLRNPEEFAHLLPPEARDAICPSARALEGVHVYRNVVAVSALKSSSTSSEQGRDRNHDDTSEARDDSSTPDAIANSSRNTSGKAGRNVAGKCNIGNGNIDPPLTNLSKTTNAALDEHKIFADEEIFSPSSKSMRFLNSMKQVPFDEPVSRSGGTVPDKTLAFALQQRDSEKFGKLTLPDVDEGAARVGGDSSLLEQRRARSRSSREEKGILQPEEEDILDAEEDVDFGDSGKQLDEKMRKWAAEERKRDYADIARLNAEMRMAEDEADDGEAQEWGKDEQEHERGSKTAKKQIQAKNARDGVGVGEEAEDIHDPHPFRKSTWRTEGVEAGDVGSRGSLAGAASMNAFSSTTSTSVSSTAGGRGSSFVFPELPDVEADWGVATMPPRSARGTAYVAAGRRSQFGLKQAKLPDSLRKYYKKDSGGGKGSSTSPADSEKANTAVQLQRILNKHIKERNKRMYS